MSELADRLDGWSNWFRDPDDTRLPKTDHISVMREAAAALRSQEWMSVEIVTLRTELQDARAVIHEIVEPARFIAALVYAYDAASEHLQEPK